MLIAFQLHCSVTRLMCPPNTLMTPKKFNLLCWNVRGLGDPNKGRVLRNCIRSSRADLVMLQETKIAVWDIFQLNRILPSYFDPQCAFLSARNSSGGCLLAWKRCYSLLNSWATRHSISVALIDNRTGFNFILTTVYGPQSDDLKLLFMQELLQLKPTTPIPWILGGDFNLVRWLPDRSNSASNPNWQLMDSFNDTIRLLQLFDVPLQDKKFTWTNKHPTPNFSKIDRIFLSPSFLTTHPLTILNAAPMVISDHVPLLLKCSQHGPRQSIKRLERFWLQYENFNCITKEVFTPAPTHHAADSIRTYVDRVNTLHSRLRTWHNCKFFNSDAYLQNCKTLIFFSTN